MTPQEAAQFLAEQATKMDADVDKVGAQIAMLVLLKTYADAEDVPAEIFQLIGPDFRKASLMAMLGLLAQEMK